MNNTMIPTELAHQIVDLGKADDWEWNDLSITVENAPNRLPLPKTHVGTFANWEINLEVGTVRRLDSDGTVLDQAAIRVSLEPITEEEEA